MAGGLLSSFLLLIFVPSITIVPIFLSMLGGLFPDFDSTNSTVAHMGFRVNKGLRVKPFYLLSLFGSIIFEHRTYTHTFIAAIIGGVVVSIITYFVGMEDMIINGVAFFLGWVSHILLDAMTVSGVPMLWPMKPITQSQHILSHKRRIKTGATFDQIFGLLLLFLFVIGVVFFFLLGRIAV